MEKRICLLRHAYFPDDSHERRQVFALLEAGYHVDVICLRRAGQPRRESRGALNIYRIPLTHRRRGIVRYLVEYSVAFVLMSGLLGYLYQRRHYALVQVNTMPDFLIFAAMTAKGLGVPILLDLHEPTPELWVTKFGTHRYRLLYRLQVLIEQFSIRFADRAITVTETLRRRFGERGADIRKISVVPNVCNEEELGPAPVAKCRSGDGFTLICHGLIEQRYGHELIIEAVSRLKDEIPGLRFEIAGFGEYRQLLDDLIVEKGCRDQVLMLGYLPWDELVNRIRNADAGVIAMRKSPYSELIHTNKMYEYIYLRVPVIASRLRAVEEDFDDSCICYFNPDDAQDLARAIRTLYHDPEKRKQLIANAWQRYEPIRWENSKRVYLQAVREAIEGVSVSPSGGT